MGGSAGEAEELPLLGLRPERLEQRGMPTTSLANILFGVQRTVSMLITIALIERIHTKKFERRELDNKSDVIFTQMTFDRADFGGREAPKSLQREKETKRSIYSRPFIVHAQRYHAIILVIGRLAHSTCDYRLNCWPRIERKKKPKIEPEFRHRQLLRSLYSDSAATLPPQ